MNLCHQTCKVGGINGQQCGTIYFLKCIFNLKINLNVMNAYNMHFVYVHKILCLYVSLCFLYNAAHALCPMIPQSKVEKPGTSEFCWPHMTNFKFEKFTFYQYLLPVFIHFKYSTMVPA